MDTTERPAFRWFRLLSLAVILPAPTWQCTEDAHWADRLNLSTIPMWLVAIGSAALTLMVWGQLAVLCLRRRRRPSA